MPPKCLRPKRCVSAHKDVASTGFPNAPATRRFHETRKSPWTGCGSVHRFYEIISLFGQLARVTGVEDIAVLSSDEDGRQGLPSASPS